MDISENNAYHMEATRLRAVPFMRGNSVEDHRTLGEQNATKQPPLLLSISHKDTRGGRDEGISDDESALSRCNSQGELSEEPSSPHSAATAQDDNELRGGRGKTRQPARPSRQPARPSRPCIVPSSTPPPGPGAREETEAEDAPSAGRVAASAGASAGRVAASARASADAADALSVHALKRSLRSAVRRSRTAALEDEEEDDEDEDESDEDGLGASLAGSEQLGALQVALQARISELNSVSRSCKGLTAADRKKIRNRKASCVSRLKKKLAHYELQGRLHSQAARIADLEAQLEARNALLRQHGISCADVPSSSPKPKIPAPSTPASAHPSKHTPAPGQRRRPGRPSKKAKLEAQLAAPSMPGLQRELSVVEDSVCLCHDRPTDSMLSCTVCARVYHAICVMDPEPASFVCPKCC